MEDITFDEAMSYEHLFECAHECKSGVAWKQSVQTYTLDRLQWLAQTKKDLDRGKYKSKGFYTFDIMERGKTRHIQSVHVSERVVQKCLCKYALKPLIEPRLIYDNGASRVGKGTEFALKRLRHHLSQHYRKYGKQGGILIMDFHDFFNSIPHGKLITMYRKIIKDDRLFNLTSYFITCFTGDVGLGLGSEVSQISAIFYTNEVDHFIKERLHIKGYGRYMDDSYLIHQDIDYLKHCLEVIREKLLELGITINPKTKIVKFSCGSFTYLKRRFTITDNGKIVTRLLRPNITKRRRTLKKQLSKCYNWNADMASIEQSYQSWRGYALKWDSRRSVFNMDRLYYSIIKEVNYELAK